MLEAISDSNSTELINVTAAPPLSEKIAPLAPPTGQSPLDKSMSVDSVSAISNLQHKQDIEYGSTLPSPSLTLSPEDFQGETISQEQLVDGPLYGWVIVVVTFLMQMVPMGFFNSYGVYQVMFSRSLFRSVPP